MEAPVAKRPMADTLRSLLGPAAAAGALAVIVVAGAPVRAAAVGTVEPELIEYADRMPLAYRQLQYDYDYLRMDEGGLPEDYEAEATAIIFRGMQDILMAASGPLGPSVSDLPWWGPVLQDLGGIAGLATMGYDLAVAADALLHSSWDFFTDVDARAVCKTNLDLDAGQWPTPDGEGSLSTVYVQAEALHQALTQSDAGDAWEKAHQLYDTLDLFALAAEEAAVASFWSWSGATPPCRASSIRKIASRSATRTTIRTARISGS